jgi:hypothetical protein
MECKECSREMTAFLDDELSQSRVCEVRSHIDSCPACTRELADLRAAVDLVSAHHRELALHPAGWSKVLVELEDNGKTSWHGRLGFGFAHWQPVAIALTGFGLTIGLWSYQRHVESRRALEHYMIQYVQARETQEQSHRRLVNRGTAGDSAHTETGDVQNPFLLVRHSTEGNPFRR